MEENPRPRRGFQLGLRLLLILLAIVAGPLGWHAWRVERQQRAVDVLWTSGATIYFDGDAFTFGLHPVVEVRLSKPLSDGNVQALKAVDGLQRVFVLSRANADRIHSTMPGCKVVVW